MSRRTILHAADIHLDSPMQRLRSYENAPVEQLRGATRRALTNLVDLAIERQVDLVVIAGDLYDGDWPDSNTGLFFVGQAQRLTQAGIPMVIIRGNHDAANQMTGHLPLPKNPDGTAMMLDDQQVDRRILEHLGIAVHGKSYRTRAEKSDLSAAYPPPLRGMFNLGLLHTSLSGLEGHAPYAPCNPGQLADKEYDYWALGHIHLRGEHHLPGSAPIVFSGNLQGRHVRETGPKGCLLVEIDDQNRPTSTFHPLDVARWEICEIDAADVDHEDEIFDRFESWIAEALSEVDDRLLVPRVRLQGRSRQHDRWLAHQKSIESSLRAIAVANGGGQVWLERFRVETESLASVQSSPNTQSNEVDDGPRGSIQAIADELMTPNGEITPSSFVHQSLEELRRKLPSELTRSESQPDLSGDDSSNAFDDGEASMALVREATAELFSRLHGTERPKQSTEGIGPPKPAARNKERASS
ncbi:MAG: DNA repair exonuclease [Planctomycetota bacterium]